MKIWKMLPMRFAARCNTTCSARTIQRCDLRTPTPAGSSHLVMSTCCVLFVLAVGNHDAVCPAAEDAAA